MAKTKTLARQSLNPENYYEYQPEFDVWSVHFENLQELSIEKVTKLFKKYGGVKNVSQTGSTQGYCFISYWRQEDAKNCVLHISKDKIKLRSFSPRIRLIKDKQLSDDPEMCQATKKKPIKTLEVSKTCENNNDTNNNLTGKKIPKNDYQKYEKYYEAKSVFFANAKKLSEKKIRGIFTKYGYIETIQQTGYPTGWCFVRFGAEQYARACAIDIMSKGILQLEAFKPAAALRARKQRKTGRIALQESSSTQSIQSDDSAIDGFEENSSFESHHEEIDPIISETHNYKQQSREKMLKILTKFSKYVPKFVQKVIMNSGKTFYVPMDSRVPWEKLQTVVVEQVPVEGIIVANIHEACSGDFLLKLFEKYQPIYVSKIKEIEEGSLKYCHVFIKTDLLARAAIMHYDNVDVYGKSLIVVRPEALIAKSFQ